MRAITLSKQEVHSLQATYPTDCFRKVKDEDGTLSVKRWAQDNQVAVTVNIKNESIYWKGARIA